MEISVVNMGKLNEVLDSIVADCNSGLMGNTRTSLMDIKLLAIEGKKILAETKVGNATKGDDDDGGKAA